MSFSNNRLSQDLEDGRGILMWTKRQTGVIAHVRQARRIARRLAALAGYGQRGQSLAVPGELKIDFYGTTAIRSPIAR